MRRLQCLDGLRGVLASYVLISHMAPFAALPAWLVHPFSHGEAAVDMFFILSGMVIAGSLDRFGGAARPFLAARATRLLPVFAVVFPIAVAIQPITRGFDRMPWIGADSPARQIWSDHWPATWAPEIAAHLTMTHGLFPNAILPDAWVSFLGAAWSLSTEWQFYFLVASLSAVLGWHRHSVRSWILPLLALSAAAVAWAHAEPPDWQFSRAFLPNKAAYFALGLASAELWKSVSPRASFRYAATLALVLTLCGVQGGPLKLLAPLAWTACLWAQRNPTGPVLRPLAGFLSHRLQLWLGAISYPVYLLNEPVQKLLGVTLSALFPAQPAAFTALWLPASILAPIAAGAVLHRAIERPFLAAKPVQPLA